jgi:hypothetical protein
MANILDEVYGETEPQKNVLDEVYAEGPKSGISGLVEAPKGLVSTFLGAGKRALESLQHMEQVGAEMPGSWMPSREAFVAVGAPLPIPGAHLEEPIEKIATAEEAWKPTHAGAIAKVARFAGEAGGSVAQIVAASAMGGAPLVVTLMGTQGYQSAYDEAKAAGESETKANIEGILNGAVNAALSVYGADKLVSFRQTGKASMGAFVRNLRGRLWQEAKGDIKNITLDTLKSATAGALTMAGFSGAGLAVPAAVSQRWPKKEDGSPDWGQILTEIGGAAIGGAVMGAGTTLGAAIPRGLHEATMPTQPKILETARQIQEAELTLFETPFEKARSLDDLKKMMPEVGAVQTAKPSSVVADPFAVPENVRQTMVVADRIQQDITPLYTRAIRKERAAEIKTKRGEMFALRSGKIEELRKQGIEPQEITRRILASEKGLLRKSLPEFKTPYTTEDVNRLQWAVQEANVSEGTKSTLYSCLKDMFENGVFPSRGKVREFDNFFGTNILTTAQGRPEGAVAKVADWCNAYKAVRASFDHSMVLRQGLILFQNHPLKGTIAVGKGLRAMWSDEYYHLADLNMRTDPYWLKAVESNVPYTEVGKWKKGEEQFGSQTAHKLPWIGKIVRGSDRAATTYLNSLRFSCFKQTCMQWEGLGRSPKAYQQLAEYLGHASGRGGFKNPENWFEKYNELLQVGFWAPRLTVGRVQTITDLYTKPEIRKMIAGDLVMSFGQGMMALGLASLIPGVKTGMSWISADFGKIIAGKFRSDFWGGYAQIMRTIAQFVTAKKEMTASEEIYHIKRREPIIKFIRGKLSPQAQIVWDMIEGKTFAGKIVRPEVNFVTQYMVEQIPPLIIGDIIDAIKNQGLRTAVVAAPMAFFGAGVQIYEDTATGTARQVKNGYAHEIFGCDWNDLGPEAQNELRRNRPLIGTWEEKVKYERENYDFAGMIIQESQETGRRIQKGLSNKVQKELDGLEIKIGGIPRRIGSNWYLNEKRFTKYEKDLRETLEKVLSETVSQSGWNEVGPETQKLYLEQMIKDVKTHIRGQLVETSDNESRLKYEDLQKVLP